MPEGNGDSDAMMEPETGIPPGEVDDWVNSRTPYERMEDYPGSTQQDEISLAMLAELFQYGITAVPRAGVLLVVKTSEPPDDIVMDIHEPETITREGPPEDEETAKYHLEGEDGAIAFTLDEPKAAQLYEETRQHILEVNRRRDEEDEDEQ